MAPQQYRAAVIALVVLRTGFAAIFLDALPIVEGSDEFSHIGIVEHLVTHRRYPALSAESPPDAFQPPLYYAIGALVAAPAPPIAFPLRNPHWGYNPYGVGGDNKNQYLHTAAEEFPYRGASLTIHLLRLLAVAFGAISVLIMYLAARNIFPHRPRLAVAATAFFALHPVAIAESAIVNNDSLATLLSVTLIYLAIRSLRCGTTGRLCLAVGATTGLLWLTKLTPSYVLVPAWAAVALSGQRSANIRRLVRSGTVRVGIMAGLAVGLSGGWFLRNYRLYGDVTAVGTANRQLGITGWFWQGSSWYLRELSRIFRGVTLRFGWGTVIAPSWAYYLLAAAAVVALLGFLRWLAADGVTRDSIRLSAVVIVVSVAVLGTALSAVMPLINIHGPGGRLFLLPAMPAISIILCLGWRALLPDRWAGNAALSVFIGSLLGLVVYAWLGVLRPAFARPPLLEEDELPADLTAAHVQFGDLAELVGVDLPDERARPGDEIAIAPCWRVTGRTVENLTEFVHVVRWKDAFKIGARDTHPGLGNFPTSDWQMGSLFCDLIPIRINETAPAPGVYSVVVGLYSDDPESAYHQSARAGAVILAPPEQEIPSSAVDTRATFGDAIELSAFASTDTNITLYWRALEALGEDWVLFAHLFDTSDQLVLLMDAPPLDGEFPTSAWQRGDLVVESRDFSFPNDYAPGPSQWAIGWYRPDTLERLPVVSDDGLLPNGAFVIPGPILP